MKKVRTIADIKADPRVNDFVKNYDGPGVHMVELKDGFLFDNEVTIDIGSVKEICDYLNNYVTKNED